MGSKEFTDEEVREIISMFEEDTPDLIADLVYIVSDSINFELIGIIPNQLVREMQTKMIITLAGLT